MASESFDQALVCTLRHEGGYVDHPSDPGGATMLGITRATLAAWRGREVGKDEVRALTRKEAGEIYRARYWQAVRGDDLPAGLDLAVFDLAVNSGPDRAIRTLQAILNVPVDGRMGPQTLAAMAGIPVMTGIPIESAIKAMSVARFAFLRRLSTYPVFGKGWTRRVLDIEANALSLAKGASPAPSILPADPASPTALPPSKETNIMEFTKTIFESRTIWANLVGVLALMLSWLGFDTSFVDKNVITDHLFQIIAGMSFLASTFFRVIASKKLL
jgi:lysozyme family protein